MACFANGAVYFNNEEGHYQRYDWETHNLAELHTVPVGGIVIIEGVYSIRKELANKYDFIIWVECPREIRLSRGLERDGEEARGMWDNNWMIAEDLILKNINHMKEQTLLLKNHPNESRNHF